MADAPLTPEERDALVAELALGLLEGDARAAALRQLMADPDFSPGLIDAWHNHLEPLYGEYAPVPPPEGLWVGIDARIAQATQPIATSNALRRWRAGALAAGAVAASLAMLLIMRPTPPGEVVAPAQVAVAQMTGAPDGPVIVARYDPAAGSLRLRPTGIAPGPLSPELWIIPTDGKPRSLGMIGRSGESRIGIDPAHRAFMAEGATLAITMERAEGAPHDAPSSAPVAAGKISLI